MSGDIEITALAPNICLEMSPLEQEMRSGCFAPNTGWSVVMAQKDIYSKASNVSAEDGVVNVDGPDGVDVGLTPEAALETSDRLLDGARVAAGQRRFRHSPHPEQEDSDGA